ncbi:MAG: phosphatase PAP2 family protein [Erysipelotrichaceae bacterium]|nr:phosphatase PAP2 family protein [Erysipelotrichaceae bacterium]
MNTTDMKTERKFVFGLLCVFAVLILAGAFVDWDLAVSLYTPKNAVWTAVSNYGQLLFYLGIMMFFGVLCGHTGQIEGRSRKKAAVYRVLWLVLACAAAWATKKSAIKTDILFGFLSSQKTVLRFVCFGLFYVPAFAAGYFFRIKEYNRDTERRLMFFVILTLSALASVSVLKDVFARPRPNTLFKNGDSSFVPWFGIPVRGLSITAFPAEDAYYSFPSAHAVCSIPLVCLMPAFASIVPALKPHKKMLAAAGLTAALLVIASRMILGAHFLSDVSAGAVIGLLFLLPYVFYSPVTKTAKGLFKNMPMLQKA